MNATQTAAVSAAAATFARLADGSCGVRVNGPAPVVGAAIEVAKKDGTSKTVSVASIVWHGTARNGQAASLITISDPSPSPDRARRSGYSGGSYSYRDCDACVWNQDAGDMDGCPRHRGNPHC